MTALSRQIVENICMQDGLFTIPDNIKKAVEQCIVTDNQDPIIEGYHQLRDKYKSYRKLMIPAKIDYRGDITHDVYTIFYLPRNIIIPWIALRDLSLHRHFQTLPKKLNILDLGSGTGAIVLGLLHLFNDKTLSATQISIVSVDYFPEALKRQKKLVKTSGFSLDQISWMEVDLENLDDSIDNIKEYGPYDFVFCGNCFTELTINAAKNIITQISSLLTENGVVVIAEAQRDYIKVMTGKLARLSNEIGLSVYYPCPKYACSLDRECWVWRNHDYDFPSMNIAGQPLKESPREDLVLSWLILTKKRRSLYRDFRKNDPHLFFGSIAQEKSWDRERRRRVIDYGICTGKDIKAFKRDFEVSECYNRGSIVGLTDDCTIGIYHDLN